jgi:lysophospholipase L1-like esterase
MRSLKQSGTLTTPAESEAYGKRLADVGLLSARPVASHPFELRSTQSDIGQYQRTRHHIYQAATEIRFVYGNYTIGSGDIDVANSITVKASMEYPLGTYWPIHFPGEDANGYVTLRPGKFIVSDPICATLTVNSELWVNTLVAPVGGTGVYPVGGSISGSGGTISEWRIPATTTDYTVSAPSGTNSQGPGYAPLAIIGRCVTDQPVWAIIGDSIPSGTGDSAYMSWGTGENGWARRSLNNIIPYVFISRGSTLARDWPNRGSRYSAQLLNRCTHALVTFGTNDLTNSRTLAQIQADLTAIWQAQVDRGIKVYQATILPNTTSTDSWATLANQTPVASNSVRTQLNDWIRTIPAPLSGIVEIADIVESARNSGKWIVNGTANYPTADGTHPSAATHALIAAAWTPSATL